MKRTIVRSVITPACALLILSCGGGDDGGNGGTGGNGGGTTPVCARSAAVRAVLDFVPRSSHCAASITPSGDPLYVDQWHLKNTTQLGGTLNEDLNVEPAWLGGCGGTGVRIAVVDDGLEINHEDLRDNVVPGASLNYTNCGTDPTGGAHGTLVAGTAAARDNGVGVLGTAPRAGLVGYNLLAAQNTTNEADAMVRDAAANSVSSNSWGAPDGFGTLDAPTSTWVSAIDTGLSTGRGGRGLIYTWAAGNGAPTDNSNYDGQANYYGIMAIAALNNQGQKASYSELGANLWVSTYGGEFCGTHAITTVDRTGNAGINTTSTPSDYSNKNYTKCFNGTSSATPQASGVIALVLEKNPNLGWRDVRQIIAKSARQNHAVDGDWRTNAAGIRVNHKYGFGVMDANAAVNLAATWTNVGTLVTQTYSASPNGQIPEATGTPSAPIMGDPLSNTINVTGSGIGKIEFVEVVFTSNHTYAGDLQVVLSKAGSVESRLAEAHICRNPSTGQSINCGAGYASGWRFGDARHLDESADGDWTLTVRDGFPEDTGTFQSWTLRIYGRAN